MKKMICVTNKNVADELAEMGFRHMTQNVNGCDVYTFVESEKLLDALSDKRRFSKEHWYMDKRLRF